MIQFISCCLLYWIGSNFTDVEYLYTDLFQIIPLSMFMGWTGAYDKLTHHLPEGSLISLPVLISVFGSVAIQFAGQLFIFILLHTASQYWWFIPLSPSDDAKENYVCYESTAVFLVGCFQYLVTCISFSISKPFRKPLYTNSPFTISIIGLFCINVFLTMFSTSFSDNLFGVSLIFHNTYTIVINIPSPSATIVQVAHPCNSRSQCFLHLLL